MRNFLLLVLSLMAGCEAHSVVTGCTDGWVEFNCKYPKTTKTYQTIEVKTTSHTLIKSLKKNEWEMKDKYSVYHDTKNKTLRVIIKQLQQNDSGTYSCVFNTFTGNEKTKLVVEKDGCQAPFNQTAYRTAKTTISCDKRKKDDNKVRFFCKENGSICENILTTKSSLKSNGTFTLTETNSSFNMSISNVSSQHAGVYWCGVETGSYRTALRKIQLKVQDTITNFTRSPTIGQNLTYWCKYSQSDKSKTKFICKGEDPSTCETVGSTAQLNKTTGKFSMKDDKDKKNITITVRNVTTDDSGTYWCGAESTNKTISNLFFHRCVITVVQPTTSTVSPTQPTTVSAESHGSSRVIIPVIVCVLLLLLLGLILILIYKRHSKNKRNAAAAQHIKEDYTYEEIQQPPDKPDSGPAINTIYATANFPTKPSASLLYSTINFANCSGEAGGEARIIRPSSSACEYSTVNDHQRPTSSTVNQPPSGEPLYSTVNKPQERRDHSGI